MKNYVPFVTMTSMCLLAIGCKSGNPAQVSKTESPSVTQPEVASDGTVLAASVKDKDVGKVFACLKSARISAFLSSGRGVTGIRVKESEAKALRAILIADSKKNNYEVF